MIEKLKKSFNKIYMGSIIVFDAISFLLCISSIVLLAFLPITSASTGMNNFAIGFFKSSSIFFGITTLLQTIFIILFKKRKHIGFILQALYAILLIFLFGTIAIFTILNSIVLLFDGDIAYAILSALVSIISLVLTMFEFDSLRYYVKIKRKLFKDKYNNQEIDDEISTKDGKEKSKISKIIDKFAKEYYPFYCIVIFNLFTMSAYYAKGSGIIFPTFFVGILSVLIGFSLLRNKKFGYQMQMIHNPIAAISLILFIFEYPIAWADDKFNIIGLIIVIAISIVGSIIHFRSQKYYRKKYNKFLKGKVILNKTPKLKANSIYATYISILPIAFMPSIIDLFGTCNKLSIGRLLGENSNFIVVLVTMIVLTGLFPLTGYLLERRHKIGYALQFATTSILGLIDLALLVASIIVGIIYDSQFIWLIPVPIAAALVYSKISRIKYYIKNKEHFYNTFEEIDNAQSKIVTCSENQPTNDESEYNINPNTQDN